LSSYLHDADGFNKVHGLQHRQIQAMSTGLLGSDRPSANDDPHQEATNHTSVHSASTLPEEDHEPMRAGSFVMDGRIVAPPAIHEEVTDLDSCHTEANQIGEGFTPEASLPSCITEMPEMLDMGHSLPSTPGATAQPVMPSNSRGTCASASLSPSGSQPALVDPDSRFSLASRQSRSGTVVLPSACGIGQSPVLGMQSQIPPQTQQQQQQQRGSQARQASQRRWTAPAQPSPAGPDAWSPQEPQSATSVERQQGSRDSATGSVCIMSPPRQQGSGDGGSVCMLASPRQQGSSDSVSGSVCITISPPSQQGSVQSMSEGSTTRAIASNGGISSFPLTLLQAELLGQLPPPCSRTSLPAGLKSNTSSAVVYKPPPVSPTVQPPIMRQSTPNSQQQPQQQQTPLRATTPTRRQRQPSPSQPHTPSMGPWSQALQIPSPPLPAIRTSVGSQNGLKQPTPSHKQQPTTQQRRLSEGTPPQRRGARLCAGYSTSPRRCIHSRVGPAGAWH